jgi:hypothetical protein
MRPGFKVVLSTQPRRMVPSAKQSVGLAFSTQVGALGNGQAGFAAVLQLSGHDQRVVQTGG